MPEPSMSIRSADTEQSQPLARLLALVSDDALEQQVEQAQPDRRFDFGVTLAIHRCFKCQGITWNRGDQETGNRYCLECFNLEFPCSFVSSGGSAERVLSSANALERVKSSTSGDDASEND